jgi:hypothetical protein
MGSEGGFMGSIMGYEIPEHSSACHKKVEDIMGSHNARNTNIMRS